MDSRHSHKSWVFTFGLISLVAGLTALSMPAMPGVEKILQSTYSISMTFFVGLSLFGTGFALIGESYDEYPMRVLKWAGTIAASMGMVLLLLTKFGILSS